MSNKVIESRYSFEDFIGNKVKVGDFVVYATICGRSPVQKFAQVERIDLVENEYGYGEGPFIRVGVREISNGRNFRRWDSYDWKKKVDKRPRVTYPMAKNIVLVRSVVDGPESPQ